MSFECNKCGDEFDSERGLHIHQSQKHEGKENNEENNTIENSQSSSETSSQTTENGITLTTAQFGGLTLAAGLFLGILLGMMFGGTTTANIGLPAADNGEDSPSNSNVVELSTTEFPYEGVEAGVGSSNKTIGGTTFNLDGEPYIGSSDADVTAVSYEDFECPYCGQYNKNAYPQIVENHVQTGEVQYFYKNLPLSMHPWAEPAALASECALNQDPETFWIFKQGFFNNQDQLSNTFDSGNFDATMYHWADQTGLDTEQFKQCYDNREEINEVTQDKQEGGSNGAQATPTVFINGEKLEGAQPYSRFESAINSALQ